jgi:multidrug efflux pump
LNGQPAVTLKVSKRSGENIVRVVTDVKKAVQEMKSVLPPKLEISLTADKSEDVNLMVQDLENNILSGLVLVLLVIFLLFIGGRSPYSWPRPFRNTPCSSPLSVLYRLLGHHPQYGGALLA